jgi:hypothetical protein
LVGYTFEQQSLGGINAQIKHAASAAAGNPILFGGNRSLGGTNANKKKNGNGKSVKVVKQHEVKNADDKSVLALKMLAKRKYSGKADKGTANYKCPNCSNFYLYPTPHDKDGHKRRHQRRGGKSQVLVPYHAVH